MKHRFFAKLFLGYLSIVVCFAAGLFVFIPQRVDEHHMDSVTEFLKGLSRSVGGEIAACLASGDGARLASEVRHIGRILGVRVTVILPDGRVAADSELDPAGMENHGTRPEVSGALMQADGHAVRFSQTQHEQRLYMAARVPDLGAAIGVVRLSVPVRDVHALEGSLVRQILGISVVLLMACLLLALFVSRRLSGPVGELARAAERISEGDFDVRLFPKRSDELRGLADAFNRMARQIQVLFAEKSRDREEQAAILSSIQEGLAVVDANSRVVHVNEAFKRSFRVSGAETAGRPYWEFVRGPEFAGALQKVIESKEGRVEEIAEGGAVFMCSFSSLPADGRVVVLFFDVTEMKRLEAVKRDLVASISHEFKTPLTAIRGFAEALETETGRKADYLEIIKRNADRLTRITNDLLVLSRLEYRERPLEREPVDLAALARKMGDVFKKRLEEKPLALSVEAEDGLPAVEGDPYMLEQVFVNLVDNAIRYSETGGITVRLMRQGESVAVEVEDTGVGIPADHLPRIFERFYVVDKSRSRETGGTGLGLSIIRNIVLRHGGDVSVSSTPGRGTTFAVRLPAIRGDDKRDGL